MKTKLVISIEVEENLSESISLYEKLKEGELKIKDIFNPEAPVFVYYIENLNSVRINPTFDHQGYTNSKYFEDPKKTEISLGMYTRGLY